MYRRYFIKREIQLRCVSGWWCRELQRSDSRRDDMSNNDLVTVNNLTFSRGERKIFDGIDLHVPEGKVTAIMGPSGIGKTTLLLPVALNQGYENASMNHQHFLE